MTRQDSWDPDGASCVRLLALESQTIPADRIVAALAGSGITAGCHWIDPNRTPETSTGAGDVIILRHEPPRLDGIDILGSLRRHGYDAPCILIASDDEEQVVEWMRRGAWDVVSEARIERIGAAVTSALRERQAQAASRHAEDLALRAHEEAFEQLRRLSVHVQEAREAERSRLSREVHDGIGQALTVLKLDVTWIRKRIPAELEEVRQRAQEVLETIDLTIDQARSIAQHLRPPILDEAGLSAAVEWATRDFGRRMGIPCSFEGRTDVNLGGSTSTAVFRALQEALNNVARHAQATRVEVSLDERNGVVELTVLDNGRGMTIEEANGNEGVGLMQIREIAASLGGWAEIESLPTGGTVVRLSVFSSASDIDAPSDRSGAPE